MKYMEKWLRVETRVHSPCAFTRQDVETCDLSNNYNNYSSDMCDIIDNIQYTVLLLGKCRKVSLFLRKLYLLLSFNCIRKERDVLINTFPIKSRIFSQHARGEWNSLDWGLLYDVLKGMTPYKGHNKELKNLQQEWAVCLSDICTQNYNKFTIRFWIWHFSEIKL